MHSLFYHITLKYIQLFIERFLMLDKVIVFIFFLQVLGEIQEIVKTGLWVGDCFIYTSSVNRLNYYVGGEIVTIAHLDRYLRIISHLS